MNRAYFVVILGLLSAALPAQSVDFPADEEAGPTAVAEKYLLWAEDAISEGQWQQALAALERASDFADELSDISYLLALARSKENESRTGVLQALELAIETGHWLHYTEAHARLLQADQLIALRRYSEALDSLAVYRAAAGDDADYALLRLAALKGLLGSKAAAGSRAAGDNSGRGPAIAITLPVPAEFRRRMLEAIDRYPRDPRLLRVLFSYARDLQAAGHNPDTADLALVEIALKRLPFVLEQDPDLAWMAAPFIGDTGDARRLVAAYRAGGFGVGVSSSQNGKFKPNPASIIQALNLGLLDDVPAIDELFTETTLEKEQIIAVADLLRSGEGREYLVQKLHGFTGDITENEDNDNYPESRAVYRQGSLQEYYHDIDQDGVTDFYLLMSAGVPRQAEIAVPSSTDTVIHWERYPYVQTAVLGTDTYRFAPGVFPFAPVNVIELGATDSHTGLLFPERNPPNPGINRRMLASSAVSVQFPSAEFAGGVEQVLLERGIPVRAEITLDNALVAVTEYQNGSPAIQRLDLDLDGRMETVRRFRGAVVRSSESDWSGTGAFSTGEVYQDDGSVVYIWDLDGSGHYRYSETRE